jgi:hypothetical protein
VRVVVIYYSPSLASRLFFRGRQPSVKCLFVIYHDWSDVGSIARALGRYLLMRGGLKLTLKVLSFWTSSEVSHKRPFYALMKALCAVPLPMPSASLIVSHEAPAVRLRC